MTLTTDRTIVCGATGAGGYRPLLPGRGEPHAPRRPGAGSAAAESLLTVAHLSDLHVCDAQSPARVEFLDRWADPDSPVLDQLGEVGTYRAQEMLTAQVVEAMVARGQRGRRGTGRRRRPSTSRSSPATTPTTRRPTSSDWYLALLDGGTVRPDSGDLDALRRRRRRRSIDDERFWHPDRHDPDLPRVAVRASRRCPACSTRCGAPFAATRSERAVAGRARQPRPAAAGHGAGCRRAGCGVASARKADRRCRTASVAGGRAGAPGRPRSLRPAARWPRSATSSDARGDAGCGADASSPARSSSRAHFGRAARPRGHGFCDDVDARTTATITAPVTLLVLDTVNDTAAGRARSTRCSSTGWRASWRAPTASTATSCWPAIIRSSTLVNDTHDPVRAAGCSAPRWPRADRGTPASCCG